MKTISQVQQYFTFDAKIKLQDNGEVGFGRFGAC